MSLSQNFSDKLPNSTLEFIGGFAGNYIYGIYEAVSLKEGKIFNGKVVSGIEIIRVHDLFNIPKLLRREGRA